MNKFLEYFSLFLIICGITTFRQLEWMENQEDHNQAIQVGVALILIPIIFLFFPFFINTYRQDQQNQIEHIRNHTLKKNQIPKSNYKEQKTAKKKLKSNVSYSNKPQIYELSLDSDTKEKLEIDYSQSTTMVVDNLNDQEETQNMTLNQLLQLIRTIPEIVCSDFVNIIINQRQERRNIMQLMGTDPLIIKQYVEIVENEQLLIQQLIEDCIKQQLKSVEIKIESYEKLIEECLEDYNQINEINQTKLFVKKQLYQKLKVNKILLLYDYIYVVKWIIENQLNQYYTNLTFLILRNFALQYGNDTIIDIFIQDLVHQEFEIEEEDLNLVKNIHQNDSNIIRIQYEYNLSRNNMI